MKRCIRKSISARTKFRRHSKKSLESQQLISKFHRLNEKLADLQDDHTMSSVEKNKKIDQLEREMDELGGLSIYQQASLHGAKLHDSSKWLIRNLIQFKKVSSPFHLLDIGALTLAYDGINWIRASYIDLHPQLPSIQRADFFEFQSSSHFDVICLSLVLNFVGSAQLRGKMICKAHEMLNDGGYLYIVLPIHCISNSILINNFSFVKMMQTHNFTLTSFHQSNRLIFYLFTKGGHVSVEVATVTKDFLKGKNRFNIEF